MELAVYARRGRRAEGFIRAAAELNLPYVLDASNYSFEGSPYLHAVELEEEFPTPPALLVLPGGDLRKHVHIADLLGVGSIAMPPPPRVEELAEVYEEARGYGIEVHWLYGEPPLARPADVEAVAEAVHPRAARVVYDAVKAKSMRGLLYDLVKMQSNIATLYMSNRRGPKGPRLPPFDPAGAINYAYVVQAALLLQWDGRFVLRMSPQYLGELKAQAAVFNEVVETYKGGKSSKRVRRMVARIFDEIFDEGGLD